VTILGYLVQRAQRRLPDRGDLVRAAVAVCVGFAAALMVGATT
jgi:hypothetical protein